MKFQRRTALIVLTTALVATAAAVGCSSDATVVDTDAGTTTDSGVKDTGTLKDSGADTAPPATYTISASVVGLKGAGLILTDKTAGDLAVTAQLGGATQKVVISAKALAGTGFDISVKSQPSNPTQTCVVTGGKGSVVAGDVTSITVNCTDLYTVGGTVVGLSGKDLILENASGGAVDSVTLNMNGQFAFAKPIPAGATYAVSVKQNPTADWQTCTIAAAVGDAGADGGDASSGDGGAGRSSGTATANVTNLVVNCTANLYPVSVKVAGLTGSGLVLQNTLADNLSAAAVGTYAFATSVASGATYDVTVLTQPQTPWQTCAVTNGKAKMLGAAVVLDVVCTTNAYKIGGTLTGLQGNGLVLQDNAGDDLMLNGAGANGSFKFATSVMSGNPFAVTIKTQPNGVANESCAITTGTASGTVAGADVTTVTVTCSKGFAATQVVKGKIVTCGQTSSNATYTECTNLTVEGLYFPNGITCGPAWSNSASPYTDLAAFCQEITGKTGFQAYYVCDQTKSRATFKAGVWGTTNDNGFTQSLRCNF